MPEAGPGRGPGDGGLNRAWDGAGREAVSRRAVMGASAALTVPILGGCGAGEGGGGEARAAVDPEVTVLVGAIAAEHGLIALYEAARRAHASLARHIDSPLAHHREHLTVLRRFYVSGSGDRASAVGAVPKPGSPQAPPKASQALASLRQAESKAAAARAGEVARAGPGLAQLLASIGACEAGHAAALARVSLS